MAPIRDITPAVLSASPGNQFVYVIGPATGPQKVGISANPSARLRSLQVGSGPRLVLRFAEECSKAAAAQIERALHSQLRHRNVGGEWFDVSPAHVVQAAATAIRLYKSGANAAPDYLARPDGLLSLAHSGEVTHAQAEAGAAYRELRMTAAQEGLTTGATRIVDARVKLARVERQIAAVSSDVGYALMRNVVVKGKDLGAYAAAGPHRDALLTALRAALDVVVAELDAHHLLNGTA